MSISVAQLKIANAINEGKRISKYDAAKLVPCHHRTAQRALKKMHSEGTIRVCDWQPVYRQLVPVYSLKYKLKDKAKPNPIKPIESNRKYRAKLENKINISNQKRAKRIIDGAYRSGVQDQIFNLIVRRAA